MQRKDAQHSFRIGTSRGPRRAATLLAQVADLERGERIKELRETLHLTQPVVAERVGVTLRAYQEWEAGGGIQWENAKRLAKVLDTSPDFVMSGDRSETPDVLGSLAASDVREILGAIGQLDEQVRLLRAETAARDAEALTRLDELRQPIPGSQRRRQQ